MYVYVSATTLSRSICCCFKVSSSVNFTFWWFLINRQGAWARTISIKSEQNQLNGSVRYKSTFFSETVELVTNFKECASILDNYRSELVLCDKYLWRYARNVRRNAHRPPWKVPVICLFLIRVVICRQISVYPQYVISWKSILRFSHCCMRNKNNSGAASRRILGVCTHCSKRSTPYGHVLSVRLVCHEEAWSFTNDVWKKLLYPDGLRKCS
jgi:hypothetical protein